MSSNEGGIRITPIEQEEETMVLTEEEAQREVELRQVRKGVG